MDVATAALVLCGLWLSLSLERFVRPGSPGATRPAASLAIHAGLFLLVLALVTAISRRPMFSVGLVIAGQFLVIQVSNAKWRALREPFIFSDFGIFSQTIKHPRLYLPFLGLGRACLIALVAAGTVGTALWLEYPLPHFLAWSGIVAAAGFALLAGGVATASAPLLDPEKDIARHGLFASVAQYWLREKTRKPLRKTSLPSIIDRTRDLPDIVVIQSESFFDPRDRFPGIRTDVLKNFDEARASANLCGKLTVPAWGANTMRPEFAFLTGIEPAALDIHRFNPYRRVTRRPIRALPAVMREAGYSTTCIHPHPARFFRRDRAFPNLGFERFVDIREFRNAPRCGPYIGDGAVTDKLLETIERANSPAFYFVITMENHGPLHLENLADHETREFFTTPPPASCADLGVYLRHLKNADEQLGRLRQTLQARGRPYALLFYGEHLPSMPLVYDVLGLPDGRTDYFIESSTQRSPETIDLAVEELPRRLLGTIV
jgi:hypothetical protein